MSAPEPFDPAPFRPAWWLPGRHVQTVGGRFLRPHPGLELRRVRLATPDEDFLDLDLGPDPGPGAPVVLVLHGLEGSTRRKYMRGTMAGLSERGILPVGMNFRSCSGEPNRRPRFYHSGETSDPLFVLGHLRRSFPGRRIGAVGFSLGGNVLLRLLGELGGDAATHVDAAVAISVPFDLARGSRVLEETRAGRLYAGYFLRSLKRKTRAKAEILSRAIDLDRALRARTLREFDEAATAPLHGYRDSVEYYGSASSAPVLHRIRVPTLVLHAMDDPFLPADAIPMGAIRGNPALTGALPPTGGHVGFVTGRAPWRPRFWAEEEAARFLGARLGME